MATDITINLTDEREAELVALTEEANRAVMPPDSPLTPAQFFRRHAREWLDLSAQQRSDSERLRLRQLFNAATPEEQANILGILDKYR